MGRGLRGEQDPHYRHRESEVSVPGSSLEGRSRGSGRSAGVHPCTEGSLRGKPRKGGSRGPFLSCVVGRVVRGLVKESSRCGVERCLVVPTPSGSSINVTEEGVGFTVVMDP